MPEDFLWGAATSAHQTEGDNTTSDWWASEQRGLSFIREPSGQACDSWHRWPEDMDLLRDAGFTDYRFGIEWARIEPSPGSFSDEALEHYAAMVQGAIARGLRPLVTLHHFTSPAWFSWAAEDAVELFARYVGVVVPLLEGVRHVCTINEPNILAMLPALLSGEAAFGEAGLPEPDAAMAAALVAAHRAARAVLRQRARHVLAGWSVACQSFDPLPGAEEVCTQIAHPRETRFLEVSRDDDWVGVQSYTRTRVGPGGVLPPRPPLTLTGWEIAPEALGTAIRTASQVAQVPVIVTENGIATADDDERIAYTSAALEAMSAAMDDGVDVRGYFHWSLLDNYEWGRWSPTFGLVAVDRTTFARTPKPSLRWLGARLRTGDPVAP